MDKEYILLSEIDKNKNITQRELSKKSQISLGGVNILLNKMVHEGFVKIQQIPMNRVAYMLTPKGIAEKMAKTSSYIKHHYSYIVEVQGKIRNALDELEHHGQVYVLLENDEISEIVKLVVANSSRIHCVERNSLEEYIEIRSVNGLENITVVALNIGTYEAVKKKNYNVVNLLESI